MQSSMKLRGLEHVLQGLLMPTAATFCWGAFFHSLVEELDVCGALRGTGNCCLQFQHCQNNIGRNPCSATRVNLELNLKCFLRFLSFKMDFVNFISEYATSVGALEVCFSAPQAGRFWWRIGCQRNQHLQVL